MMAKKDVVIRDTPTRERASLGWILEESFEGWYLLHSKRTLRDIEVVRVAMSSGKPIGLVMLKTLEGNIGHVYYIAVARAHRKRGIAKLLLEDALRSFKISHMEEVFASVEKNNKPSEALFESEGFTPTSCREASKDVLDSFSRKESGFVLVSHHQTVKFRKNNHTGRFHRLAGIFAKRKKFFARMEVLLGQVLLQSLKGRLYLVFSKERPIRDVFTSHRSVTFDVLLYQLNSALLWGGKPLWGGKVVG